MSLFSTRTWQIITFCTEKYHDNKFHSLLSIYRNDNKPSINPLTQQFWICPQCFWFIRSGMCNDLDDNGTIIFSLVYDADSMNNNTRILHVLWKYVNKWEIRRKMKLCTPLLFEKILSSPKHGLSFLIGIIKATGDEFDTRASSISQLFESEIES